ncbi:hypothetical protein C8R44DRAFT_883570 [Mycena epipterygia]|nr:hypothetical protein C8R44DRAFT_883570 [Mycena epipterygia]
MSPTFDLDAPAPGSNLQDSPPRDYYSQAARDMPRCADTPGRHGSMTSDSQAEGTDAALTWALRPVLAHGNTSLLEIIENLLRKINALLLLANNTVLSAEIHTTFTPLEITIYQHNNAAQTSVLRLSASTCAARAALHLDSGCEGAYELYTKSPGEASVEENPDVEDPLGLGRLRTVTREPTERGAHLRGNVFWSEAGEPGRMADRGFITVSTSVEHVELFLDESLEGDLE